MWNQLWLPILIPTLIIKSNCDDNKPDSDVIVKYGGHADAEDNSPTTTKNETSVVATTTTEATTTTTTTKPTTDTPSTVKINEEDGQDVLFVPNRDPPESREEPRSYDHGLKVKDIMMMKTVHDAMNQDFHVEKEVDAPNEDVVFISGKNHGHDKEISAESTKKGNNNKKNNNPNDSTKVDTIQTPKLNCRDLDCNLTADSICGAKNVDRRWQYRLFLNDCFFRKVNCAFKYESNRYKQVPLTECQKIPSHYIERPSLYNKKPNKNKLDLISNNNGRRNSARRSLTMSVNGKFCSHACPVSCPEDYNPECAISNTGQKRVFLNHCKLDFNSCSYSVVWQMRPLVECVGHIKADMRQNRGFIGWMQRVGIVDKKGRLVLE